MWPYATLSFTPWSCPGWSAWKWQQGLLQQNCWILVHTGYVSSLSFYSSNVIHHFCDTPPIFKLSCSNTGLVWKHLVHFCWCEYSWDSAADPHLLLLHSLLHLLYAYRGGEAQSLTWQPSSCCIPPPSILIWYLPPAESGFRVLHSGHPHVESSDLQPLKQWSEKALWNVITRKRVPSFLGLFG